MLANRDERHKNLNGIFSSFSAMAAHFVLAISNVMCQLDVVDVFSVKNFF